MDKIKINRVYIEKRYSRRNIGIIAKAKIVVSGQSQTISSGGLWGIESDSDDNFLQETVHKQLADLREQLLTLGIGKRAIGYAIGRWNGEIIQK